VAFFVTHFDRQSVPGKLFPGIVMPSRPRSRSRADEVTPSSTPNPFLIHLSHAHARWLSFHETPSPRLVVACLLAQ
jgi:hypothetical protein